MNAAVYFIGRGLRRLQGEKNRCMFSSFPSDGHKRKWQKTLQHFRVKKRIILNRANNVGHSFSPKQSKITFLWLLSKKKVFTHSAFIVSAYLILNSAGKREIIFPLLHYLHSLYMVHYCKQNRRSFN